MYVSNKITEYLKSIGATYQILGFTGIMYVDYGNRSLMIDRINNVRYEITVAHKVVNVLGADAVISFIEGAFF